MKKLEEVNTPYNRVEVWQNNAGRIDFEVSGATHATWHPRQLLTGHAWDAITAGVLSHPAPPRSLLLLGLGGGTCLRQIRSALPDAAFTAVEIDPRMVELAGKYMELDRYRVTVVEADALEWIQQAGDTFDVVIDDLYHARGDDVERPRAVTSTYLRSLKRLLTPEGSLAMNFVVGPGHDDTYRQACRSFRNHFSQTRRILPPLSYNEVLVGSQHPSPLRTSRSLQGFGEFFPSETDQEFWKELRTLKLR